MALKRVVHLALALKKLSKYGAKMNAQDKLTLLEQAADECGASVFARRSVRILGVLRDFESLGR